MQDERYTPKTCRKCDAHNMGLGGKIHGVFISVRSAIMGLIGT